MRHHKEMILGWRSSGHTCPLPTHNTKWISKLIFEKLKGAESLLVFYRPQCLHDCNFSKACYTQGILWLAGLWRIKVTPWLCQRIEAKGWLHVFLSIAHNWELEHWLLHLQLIAIQHWGTNFFTLLTLTNFGSQQYAIRVSRCLLKLSSQSPCS